MQASYTVLIATHSCICTVLASGRSFELKLDHNSLTLEGGKGDESVPDNSLLANPPKIRLS